MKYPTLIFILFLFLYFNPPVHAQNSELDSLKKELKRCKNVQDSLRIICQITWNTSGTQPEQTKKYGDLALIKSKRVFDPELLAEAYDAAALGFRVDGDNKMAKTYYQKSLDIGYRHNLPERIAWGSYNLGQIILSDGDYDLSKTLANESRKYFKIIGNYDLLLATNQMKLKIDGISGFSEATVDTFINDIQNSVGRLQDSTYLIWAYLNLANLYLQRENRSQSLHYIQVAMELAEKSNNIKGIANTYVAIGNYFRDELANYDVALAYYNKVLKICTENDLALKAADMHIQIGNVYKLMSENNEALKHYRTSLDIGNRLNHRHTRANSYRCIGEICYQNQQYDDALSYYLKSYEIGCDECPQIKFHSVLIDVGNLYMHIKNYPEALNYYQKSLDLADSSGSIINKAISMQHLARYRKETGKNSQAIRDYIHALDLAYATNTLFLQRDISSELAGVYSETGNYKKAFELMKTSNILKDSLEIISRADNLARLETKFEFQNLQMQKELELKENKLRAEEEINKQVRLKIYFIVGFILMTLLGLIIYSGYRRKQRDNRMLEAQKKQIEKMSEEVHKADQAKLQFFTNISHEFKTPLTLILGMTDRLKTLIHNNDQIKIIRKNSLKLLQLVNHLLDLRKIDTSKMKLSINEGIINEFIKGIVSSFEDIANRKKINLKYNSAGEETRGYFDHNKLEKILSNLLSNALKYTQEGGKVNVISGLNNDGYLTIEIIDNGIGITENEMKHIFDRFYRVSENNNQGSGIGLALVKELVEIHKGEIKADCKKNEGSCFNIILPVDKHFYTDDEISTEENESFAWNYADVLDTENESMNANEKAKPSPENKTILIVEDNRDLRSYIADIFKHKFTVVEAKDGKNGYNLAREYVPDIIISDIMMPGMTGIQLVDTLRNDVATSHIPIILLTAKNDLGTRLTSFEKGADDYISKPFDSVILKSRVENLLRLRKQLVEKFSQQFHLQPREITIENADQKFLQKAIDTIENHISNPNLNVDLLAMELNVSRTQLYRKLQALTDYPPKHFIRVIRLKRAAQILKQGQNNIAEVMDATGFSNYSYFNNCFRELFGKYPKDYAVISVKGNLN